MSDLKEPVARRSHCMMPLYLHSLFCSADVNVRVSVLTLYGNLLMNQAPLPEVQLLLRQPDGSSSSSSLHTPQDSSLSWRHRDGGGDSQPVTPSRCSIPRTPAEDDGSPLWLLRLCESLVTQPREDQSDGEGAGPGGGMALEPLPVRLEALQVGGGCGWRWEVAGSGSVANELSLGRSCLAWSVVTSHWSKPACVRSGTLALAASGRRTPQCSCRASRYCKSDLWL